ncbi:DinB family protein [Hymenobacter sp. B81]|uniref:DinB family protein n=1 Tax=Hymenobacter sp. B81 TaxID=3344878 RepID=UPI0037DCD1F9
METTLARPLAQTLLPELAHEVSLTRRMLERVPETRFGWQPHAKSMPLGLLAAHTADLIGGIAHTMQSTEIDLAAGNSLRPTAPESTAELLRRLEANGEAAADALARAEAEDFAQTWTLRAGEQVFMRQTRAEVVRHLISHTVHHRAQLAVYLRLLDVPVPSIYGPSADEAAH